MFYIGTKIVVIGSNVKRKAGPRTGSTGFIIYTKLNNNVVHSDLKNKYEFVFYEATILFTHYGFQKCDRFEIKKVLLVTPKITKIYTNVKNTIQNIKNYLNNITTGKWPMLLVSPANSLDNMSIIGGVASCLFNNVLRQKINNILNFPNSKDLPNKEKLLSLLLPTTKEVISEVLTIHNPNYLYEFLLATDKVILEDVLNLILKLNSLHDISNKLLNKRNMPANTEVQMFDSLFKPYEFNSKILLWKRTVPLTVIKRYEELGDCLLEEGKKVIIKHI